MKNELALRIINQMDDIVFWETNDTFTQQIYLSTSFENIWGRKCDWMISNTSNWYASIYSNDINNVITNTRVRLLQKTDFNLFMYRIILPDNRINYIRDICCKTTNNTFIGFSEQLSASTWEYLSDNKVLSTNQATFHISIVTLLKLLFAKKPMIPKQQAPTAVTNNIINLNDRKHKR